jgi:hypothetical protein
MGQNFVNQNTCSSVNVGPYTNDKFSNCALGQIVLSLFDQSIIPSQTSRDDKS